MTAGTTEPYPARLTIDYPDRDLDRLSTGLRIIYVIPIEILVNLIGGVLFLPVAALIVVRQKYPRWLFDFNLELTRLTTRAGSYAALMSDEYPSSDEEQNVHLEVDYPDVQQDLNRWMPLVKWLLAIPHFIVLILLGVAAMAAVIVTWFIVLFTGRYPRGIFDFVEGVFRWALRVEAYAFLLTTDTYPPFSLD
ncbi:MAG: DUF4389 domain-containing protein [Actinomycetia bacterium]|nr:DUF4389 domain-containing protein [Actinomycetes bacterium]MCP4224025.1 DUF4389 domain-containing protein [Actinomycetes bacterium]MCP5033431.1 DUF4389 domain-containing protein [Actinomycetes bacterium]